MSDLEFSWNGLERMAHNEEALTASGSTARVRTFLKGMIYYDKRRTSVACTIRQLSSAGARLTFESHHTLPDSVELYIPQKQETYEAIVTTRHNLDVDIEFTFVSDAEPSCSKDVELFKRIERLESDVATLKRVIKKISEKVLPAGFDIS